MVTHHLADYESLAVKLCKDPAQLLRLRQRVLQSPQRATLFDGKRLARQIETAYSQMADRHAQGLPPKGFWV